MSYKNELITMDALLFLTGWVFWLLSEIKKKFAMFLFCEYIETHVSYIRGLVSGDWLVTFNLPNASNLSFSCYMHAEEFELETKTLPEA